MSSILMPCLSMPPRKNTGFTLVELVAVIVILAIVSAIGTGFIVSTIESYQQASSRAKLVQQGRQAVERVTREFRRAVPNSVRVSSNNLCIEWLPIVAGGNYVGVLPDQSNGAPGVSSVDVAPLTINDGTAQYIAVAPLVSGEVYGAAPALANVSSINTGAVPNVITLTASKQFLRNSVNRRLFVADTPKQLCVNGGELRIHEGYTSGSLPANGDLTGSPPNTGVLLTDGVSLAAETPFSISSGTQTRNTLVFIELPIARSNERVVFRHQVMVRNVP